MLSFTPPVSLHTYHYQYAAEILGEPSSGFLGDIKYAWILRDTLGRAVRETRPWAKKLREELPLIEKESDLKELKGILDFIVGVQGFFLKRCKEDVVLRIGLGSVAKELEELHTVLDDVLENVELALDPSFKKVVSQALSQLPSDVGAQANKELHGWLHHT